MSHVVRSAKLQSALTCLEVGRDELELLRLNSPLGWETGAGARHLAENLRDFDWRRAAQGIIDVLSDQEGVCLGCATGRTIAAARQLEL